MANLLTKKVMENMSRQYRKENCISISPSTGQGSMGNINADEEASLLSLMRNKKEISSNKNSKAQGQRLNLEDLIGCVNQPIEKVVKGSSVITLEELAKKHSK